MRKIYFTLLIISLMLPLASNATVWTINNSGFSFSPATLTIELGDTVMFSLGSNHNAVEVSQATWNANGSTSNGGFTLAFGGGMLIPGAAQTYYYVCQPHASMGMKGQIIVNNSTGISSPEAVDGTLKFKPNPATDFTKVHTGMSEGAVANLTIFDITGKVVFRQNAITNNYLLDLTQFKKGVYFAEIRAEGYVRTSKLVIEH